MTNTAQKSRRPRVPKTVAPAEPVEKKAPDSFRLPTPLLVDLLKLLDTMPPSKVGLTYFQLQRLQPLPDEEPSPPAE